MVDASREISGELREFSAGLRGAKLILVFNKTDLGEKISADELRALLPGADVVGTVRTSAATGDGVGDLRKVLVRAGMGDLALSHGGRISAREAMEMERAAGFCREACHLLRSGAGLELAAEELRAAHQSLARVLGPRLRRRRAGKYFLAVLYREVEELHG